MSFPVKKIELKTSGYEAIELNTQPWGLRRFEIILVEDKGGAVVEGLKASSPQGLIWTTLIAPVPGDSYRIVWLLGYAIFWCSKRRNTSSCRNIVLWAKSRNWVTPCSKISHEKLIVADLIQRLRCQSRVVLTVGC